MLPVAEAATFVFLAAATWFDARMERQIPVPLFLLWGAAVLILRGFQIFPLATALGFAIGGLLFNRVFNFGGGDVIAIALVAYTFPSIPFLSSWLFLSTAVAVAFIIPKSRSWRDIRREEHAFFPYLSACFVIAYGVKFLTGF